MKAKLLQSKKASLRGERKLLAEVSERQVAKRKADKLAAAPEVGIIFMVGENLYIDGTPINEASGYGDFKIHEKDHYGYWSELSRAAIVPALEYDEVPRGRVVYNATKRTFTLFLDRCIMKRKDMVSRIMRMMHLPSTTPVETDPHYRCPGCMRGGRA